MNTSMTVSECDVELLPERSTLRTVVVVNGGAVAMQAATFLSANEAVNVQHVFTLAF